MAGIIITPAHFPGRAPIDAYGNGGFRFAGMSHRGGLLCLPTGIYAWDAPAGATELTEQRLDAVLAEASAIEILVVGCGFDLVPLASTVKVRLREVGIVGEPMSTGAAVRTFNVLLAENRAVAAALFAVD
jgi:uncharacterized protein